MQANQMVERMWQERRSEFVEQPGCAGEYHLWQPRSAFTALVTASKADGQARKVERLWGGTRRTGRYDIVYSGRIADACWSLRSACGGLRLTVSLQPVTANPA